jgi:hypothetical protein
VLPLEYSDLRYHKEAGLGFICKRRGDGRICGVVDGSGDIVLPLQFRRVELFPGGLAAVMKGVEWRVVDKSGNNISDLPYDNVNFVYGQLAAVHFKDGVHYAKGGIVDISSGDIVVPIQYDQIQWRRDDFEFARIVRVRKGDMWGVIDLSSGDVVVPIQYDNISSLHEDLITVHKDKTHSVLDLSSGDTLVSVENSRIDFSDDGLLRISNGKDYTIDHSGNIVVPSEYRRYGLFSEGLGIIRKNGNWGYIDRSGNVVIQPQYDFANPFSEGLAAVRKDGKYGYVDRTGSVIIPFQYESAAAFSEGIAIVSDEDGMKGAIDPSGNVVIPFRYDKIDEFSRGLAQVRVDGRWGYINDLGDIIYLGGKQPDWIQKKSVSEQSSTESEGRSETSSVIKDGRWVCTGQDIPSGYVISKVTFLHRCGGIPSTGFNAHYIEKPKRRQWICIGQDIPSGYVLTKISHVGGCQRTSINGWYIKIPGRLETVCLGSPIPNDYTILEETISASCPGRAGTNARKIRKK